MKCNQSDDFYVHINHKINDAQWLKFETKFISTSFSYPLNFQEINSNFVYIPID